MPSVLINGVLAAIGIGAGLHAGTQSDGPWTFMRGQMGTQVRIVLYAPDSIAARRAADQAFTRIDAINASLSDYLQQSEVSRLSRTTGQWVETGSDLWAVLQVAQEVAQESGGAFDVTIGPLSRLWRHSMRRRQLPDSAAVNRAKRQVGFKYVQMDSTRRRVRLAHDGVRLDLGGIAKGYAADEALAVLASLGFEQAVVDAGGDLAVGAAPRDLPGWEIQTESVLSNGERTFQSVYLDYCGVATSGAAYRFLEQDGVRYSHILDPRTGYGLTHERTVTVLAPSAMSADAWASAYSVMDADSALAHAAGRVGWGLRIRDRQQARSVISSTGVLAGQAGGVQFRLVY